MTKTTKMLIDFGYENTNESVTLNQVASELCELSASINALIVAQQEGKREGKRIAELLEELADVENMLYQLRRYCRETLFVQDAVIEDIQKCKAEKRFDFLLDNLG